MKYITSAENPVIKHLIKLKQKKYRDENKEYTVEGIKVVQEAIDAQQEIKMVFILEEKIDDLKEILENIDRQVPVYSLTESLFKKISALEKPEGISAVNAYGDEEPLLGGYTLFLDRVQDPGNMGTIIRTADAAGFSNVICSKGCVDIYNEKVIRAAMGSVFHINIIKDAEILEQISKFQSEGYHIIGTDLKSDVYYNNIIKREKAALIIGNEANGISREVLGLCDQKIKIPIYGKAESLNASVAAGIMMYALRGGK